MIWAFQATPLKKLWDPETPGTIAPVHRILDAMFVGTGETDALLSCEIDANRPQ